MEKRANIVDGPGYTAFLFLLPFHGSGSQPAKKRAMFLLDDPKDLPGDPRVMLLTITEVNGNGKVGDWHFKGEAGDRTFKGFFSPSTGYGWIEPV